MKCEICDKTSEGNLCQDCYKVTNLLFEMYEVEDIIRMTSLVLGEKMVANILDDLMEEDSMGEGDH